MKRRLKPLVYFDKRKAIQFIETGSGRGGIYLINKLKSLLPRGSTLLELGIGSGRDLNLLSELYGVTGSDYSQIVLDLFRSSNPLINVLLLDAVSIETSQIYDCVFSNKVLHHLSRPELLDSFRRQTEVVRPGGILFHSFWLGDESTYDDGLFFNKYRKEEILEISSAAGKIIESGSFEDVMDSDSLYVAIRTPSS